MRRVRALGFGLLALAGCQSFPLDSGRFMQLRDATTGRVMAQLAWPTPEVCALLRGQWAASDEAQRAAARLSSCHRASVAQDLPVQATLRADGTLLEVDIIDVDRCNGLVDWTLKAGDAKTEILSPCRPKQSAQAASVPAAGSERRAIAFQLEGDPRPVAGVATISQKGLSGRIAAKLPSGEGDCTGTYDADTSGAGRWAISCTNGLIATGTFRALGAGRGSSGFGFDSKGRRVEFSLGGTL